MAASTNKAAASPARWPTRWPARTSSSGCPAAPCRRSAVAHDGRRTRSSSRWPTPTPEIHPEVARRYAAVVATGRSDFPNQINNVLAFPGVFPGALRLRAPAITEGMKLAAAEALGGGGRRTSCGRTCIVPEPVRPPGRAGRRAAVAATAREDGVARI